VLLPPFHGERLERYRAMFAEIAARHVDAWPRGEPFALLPRMQALTLEAIMRVVFGEDEDGERLDGLGRLMTGLAAIAASPPAMVPWLRRDLGRFSPFHRFLVARERVDRALYAEIARRRADGGLDDRHDVLSLMLQAGMTDEELRDELMTLLVAGHETTTTALSWAFERVLRHPGMYERLAGDDRWADAVVTETLRLRPPLPVVARRVKEPYELDGHTIPAGANIAPCIWLAHRRPDVYPDPEAFRPERFLEKGPETYTWLPFGGGTRRCIGAAFAQIEMSEVLKAVAARVRLQPVDPEPERVGRRAIVLSPKRGTRVAIRA
jgi:cytochrome P450